MGNIRSFRDLQVYRSAMDGAMEIFERTKEFPQEERYAMIDQMRRSSRSVCANIAEAWRRRRSADYFRSKLGDAESEAEETRVWLEFAYRCEYLIRIPSHDVGMPEISNRSDPAQGPLFGFLSRHRHSDSV